MRNLGIPTFVKEHFLRILPKGGASLVPIRFESSSHILPGSLMGVLQVSVCLVAFLFQRSSRPVGVEEDESFESSHV